MSIKVLKIHDITLSNNINFDLELKHHKFVILYELANGDGDMKSESYRS